MSFTRINGVLHAEQCSLEQLAQLSTAHRYMFIQKAAFEKTLFGVWIVPLTLLIIKSVLR